MSQETVYMLYAFALGFQLALLYDLIRAARRLLRHREWMSSAEDLVYWCITCRQVFLMMHRYGRGMLRWFAVAGALCGIGLYYGLTGSCVVRLAEKTAGRMRKHTAESGKNADKRIDAGSPKA